VVELADQTVEQAAQGDSVTVSAPAAMGVVLFSERVIGDGHEGRTEPHGCETVVLEATRVWTSPGWVELVAVDEVWKPVWFTELQPVSFGESGYLNVVGWPAREEL
jgi:hypothetical protein